MSLNGAFPEQMPLSVLLFHEAMVRGQSLSKFADDLEIGTLSLRQLMLGKTKNPRQKTMNAICEVLGITPDEATRRIGLAPQTAPEFQDWLSARMDKRYTRSKLSQTTTISDGALRNYLTGQTLPDAHQALRLAEALEVAPLEIAAVVVANQVRDAGGELAAPMPDEEPEPFAPELAAVAEEAPVAPAASSAPAVPAANAYDEAQLLGLWRQLHPQGRRATLGYIAMLLAER
jgi:transcriptional regulator with XRE-family HTH domain